MAMAMPQLFFTASASAAAITFLAASSPMGGPYGIVGGGDGACCALAAAVAKTMARMEASPVLVCVFICFLPYLLVGLRRTFSVQRVEKPIRCSRPLTCAPSAYRSGRSPDWLKMKNPDAPAVTREAEEDWAR